MLHYTGKRLGLYTVCHRVDILIGMDIPRYFMEVSNKYINGQKFSSFNNFESSFECKSRPFLDRIV